MLKSSGVISCSHLLIYSAQRARRTTFSKGSQFIFLFGQALVSNKSHSCAFPHLDSVLLLNGRKSLANIFAFQSSSSQLLQQPHASRGVRRGSAGGGSLLRAPTAPGREKGFAFLSFPPAGRIPGADWERNPGILVTAGTEMGGRCSSSHHPLGRVSARLLLNPLSRALFLRLLTQPDRLLTGPTVIWKECDIKTAAGMLSSTQGSCIPPHLVPPSPVSLQCPAGCPA